MEAQPVPSRGDPGPLTWSRVAWLASIVFFGAFPALVLVVLASDVRGETIAIDLHQFYSAAQAILDGRTPYPPNGEPTTPWGGPYPYPPLPALLVTPLSLLPLEVAGALLMALLVCTALAVPFVLGVRDWRCYGLALLWPPVISAIQTGNLTLWLALACAIAWRFRDRRVLSSASIGVTLAAKFFLWPLVVWFAATRRTASAVLACVVGVGVLLLSWAVIGFAGFVDYPHLLRRLDELVGEDSYTTYIVGLDLGLPSLVSRGVWLALGLALVVCVALLARNGDERTAFIVAVAASLALTPIVWLHYFALLLVVVALAQPRLGALWFLPLALFITPGSGHPSPFDTAWALGVVATTIVYATWLSSAERRRTRVETAPAVEASAI
jgi:alpha-1,2-mannosyltransferase